MDSCVDAAYRAVQRTHDEYIDARRAAGRYIRQHRAALGLSLADYAHCIGYNPTYISKIENGKVYPGVELLEKARHLTADVTPPRKE